MNKELTPLERLNKIREFIIFEYTYNNIDGASDKEIKEFVEETYNFKSIETALEDFEWLKEKLDLDFVDRLGDPEDKMRLLQIFGLGYKFNEGEDND